MRISDWSSDVCSSDLPSMQARRQQHAGDQVVDRVRADRRPQRPGAAIDPCEQRPHHREIGRASCRERVCQYVSNSVVAVSLKKKKITNAQIKHILIHTSNTIKLTTKTTHNIKL